MVFPVVVYRCESWTIEKAEHRRVDAFKLWRSLLRVTWTARRANQSILKEINSEYTLERLMLKLKLQYFDHLMQRASSEYSGLISLRIDWFDLFAFQGTLKRHHVSKASVLHCSAFFIVQLSHPYMTTGKTIALTICILVSKVMSLLFNMLSRLVIAFLPGSKHLLISWLQPLSVVSLSSELSILRMVMRILTL